jgi:hypothetical protein
VIDYPAMIDVVRINDKYHVGREKPGGKVYVMGSNEAQLASYSGLTETLEWYQPVSPEDKKTVEAYLKENY